MKNKSDISLFEDILDFLHGVVGLEHHTGCLRVGALDVLVNLGIVLHENSDELLEQGFQ
jgi:hypothetical protein